MRAEGLSDPTVPKRNLPLSATKGGEWILGGAVYVPPPPSRAVGPDGATAPLRSNRALKGRGDQPVPAGRSAAATRRSSAISTL